MGTELLVVLALVIANGLFAGAEIAVLSVRKERLLERANRGDRKAIAVQSLRNQPERFLATVQIGITIISATAAAFGGSKISARLVPMLEAIGLGSHAPGVALAVVVVAISFLSIVLGELVPKSLALRYSAGFSLFVARPLLGLARLARPLVRLLSGCSNLVLRLFGDRTSFIEARTSRDELQEMVAEAARSGSIDARSSEIATRALEYADVMVSEVMVRRDHIVAIRKDASADEVQRLILEEGHSRMPVYDDDADRMIGYVVALDVLAVVWERGLVVIPDIIRPLLAVPMTARINMVLREMQARRTKIAVVVDELGGTSGLVTIEDLVEELVGDIHTEDEVPDELVRRESDTTFLVAGWVPIRKVNRALGTALPIASHSTTVAGLCMVLALTVPTPGTRLQAPDGTEIEVIDASSRRVRMVRVHQHTSLRYG
ncbi:MAG: hemolysin family protein [Kofleriaceae bacterium]